MKSLLGFGSGELKMNNIDSSHNNNNNNNSLNINVMKKRKSIMKTIQMHEIILQRTKMVLNVNR